MKSSQNHFLRVAVPSPVHGYFDYLPPIDQATNPLLPGIRVRVPFGKRHVIGVLMEIARHSDIPSIRLRHADRTLDETPLIPGDMLALARWAADYYHHPIGEVIQTLLPVSLRQGKTTALQNDKAWRLTESGKQADVAVLKRTPKQSALWRLLAHHPDGLDAAGLDAHFQRWSAPLNLLIKRGWVEKFQRHSTHVASRYQPSEIVLNPAQSLATDEIREALGSFKAFLLDGVTGSGKTEVYLQVIRETLARGSQALVLVPEIGLTPQLLERFRLRFGTVALFHSGLSNAERLSTWLAARDGRVPVVIGTRSAVFVPLKNPGVIVVDEEHDASFKQQDGFRYSARDIAVVRAQHQSIPIVLGSATPSFESLHNVDQLRYVPVALPERAGNARHPSMRLLDIRNRPLDEGLSDLLVDAIHRTVKADGQVLLFLNRRGYSPTIMCHACGQTLQCLRCDARLTLHLNGRLQCHHCGATRPPPANCGNCGSSEFSHFGQGTQRIERALEQLFPGIGIARMDRDSTRRKGSLDSLLETVRTGESRILVGTQMLAKGHDFPNVTLVGIMDADQALFGADFRASERMAQLIVQVAGRAGRAERPGEVLIQTHHPDHPVLTHLVREGYPSFATVALDERRTTGLPPYAAMALLRAEATTASPPRAFLEAAKSVLVPHCGTQVQILGPAPAPMERRAGRYRAQLLLLARQRALLQQALTTALPALDALKQARRVRWSLDVDPAEMY